MKPIDVIKYLASLVSDKGVVCGGCCRDVHLGRIPKDYDVFIFNRADLYKLARQLEGEFQYEEQDNIIYTATLGDSTVQLLYGEYFGTTPEVIVETFPFTVNQFWYDTKVGQIVSTALAKEAIKDKQLVFNKQGHISGLKGNRNIRVFLVMRATYLADKLGCKIVPDSITGIYEKYK